MADAVKPPKKVKQEVKPLTVDEAYKVLEKLKGSYLYSPTLLGIYTGMRVSEVLALRWKDIHLKEGYLVVSHSLRRLNGGTVELAPTKNKKSRRIDLEPEVVEMLKARHKEYAAQKIAAGELWQNQGFVFCREDGTSHKPHSFRTYWRQVVPQKAGVQAHFHQLRYTAASLALEAGVPLKAVSEMLGHSSIAITGDIYAHVTPAGRKEATQKLGEALRRGGD